MNTASKLILGMSLAFAALASGEEPKEGGRGVLFYGEGDAKASSMTAERKEELKAVQPHDLVTVRIKDVSSFMKNTKLSTDNKHDTKFSVNKFFNITTGSEGSNQVLRPTAGDKPAIDLSSELKRDQTGATSQKQAIEAGAARTHIPAGAPGRNAPDLSALSAREKILRGVGRE